MLGSVVNAAVRPWMAKIDEHACSFDDLGMTCDSDPVCLPWVKDCTSVV